MSDEQSTDESADSQQESEQQPTDSDQPAAQSDEQPAEQNDQSTEQSGEQAAESDQPQSEEQPTASDQATGQGEEQPTESDQPTEQAGEQPADSDQSAASGTPTDAVAFAGDAASPAGGASGVQARPGRQPTRPPRAPVPQAPVKHDFAVRFTFGTTEPGLLAKGLYIFEITAADGSRLAAHAWSSVSVTVPEDFKFSLSQITRSGEKSPSFDFHVDLRWLPFSTGYAGEPADPNDPDNADKIRHDPLHRIVTTLRPKDDDPDYLTIPPPKGTAVTKIDLHSEIGIVHDALSAPSTDENDFTLALLKRRVDRDELVEKGPPQQYTKDGVTTFLYEVKYYGGVRTQATVLP
jgi:hypothetical protein